MKNIQIQFLISILEEHVFKFVSNYNAGQLEMSWREKEAFKPMKKTILY